MQFFLLKKIFYFSVAISCFLIVFSFDLGVVQAGAGDNVSGWAWNEQAGWINFNSENCDVDNNSFIDPSCGGCDSDLADSVYGDNQDGSGSGGADCSGANATPSTDYGVDIDDTTGVASGYAWSQVKGWIAFDPPGVGTDAPGAVEAPGNEQKAVEYDEQTGEFSGWARICSEADDSDTCTGGASGWISFTDRGAGGADTYQVTLGKDSMLKGYAYSEDIGWISFSSDNCDANRDGWGDGAPCPDGAVAMSAYGVGLEANVMGYAWSATHGWISLNCRNAGAKGCGHFYGVNIDPVTYNIGGYAWSSSFGWLSFESSSVPDNNNLSSCLNACNDSANDFCTACFNFNDGNVYGWAKVLSMGDEDGWIRFDHDGGASIYGVQNSGASLEGFAWGGAGRCSDDYSVSCGLDSDCTGTCDDVAGIGWVSFNCADHGTCSGGSSDGDPCTSDANCLGGGTCDDTCGSYTYGPNIDVNVPPTITAMTAPNWGSDQACEQSPMHPSGTGEPLGAQLDWTYSDIGDTQSAYRVQVVRVNGNQEVIDTGKCTGIGTCDGCGDASLCRIAASASSYPVYHTDPFINAGTNYRWFVTVWDGSDVSSGQVTFDTSQPGHAIVDGLAGASSDEWRTYSFDFPRPVFSWFPQNPSANEEVRFVATSSVCDPNCKTYTWDWEEEAGSSIWSSDSPDPDNSYEASTTVITFTESNKDIGVELTLTNGTVYSCSTSTDSDQVKRRLPDWVEGR